MRCQSKQARPHIKPAVCPTGDVNSDPRVDSRAAALQSWPAGLSLKTPGQKDEKRGMESKRGLHYATRVPGYSCTRDTVATRWLPKPPDHHKRPRRVKLLNLFNRHVRLKSGKMVI